MTDFEKHLSRAVVRQIPSHWREEILAAAEKSQPEPASSGIRAFYLTIRGLLWPHPAAWAALAACWTLTGLLCLSCPRGPALYAVTPPGVKPLNITPEQYAVYLMARDALLARPSPGEPEPFNRRKL